MVAHSKKKKYRKKRNFVGILIHLIQLKLKTNLKKVKEGQDFTIYAKIFKIENLIKVISFAYFTATNAYCYIQKCLL